MAGLRAKFPPMNSLLTFIGCSYAASDPKTHPGTLTLIEYLVWNPAQDLFADLNGPFSPGFSRNLLFLDLNHPFEHIVAFACK